MNKFTAGQTYFGRFISDYDSTIEMTVVCRTQKTIFTAEGKRFRVKECDGTEFVMPLGSYSMAPTISADRVKVTA